MMEVAGAVFQYRALLIREGPQRWVFEEMRAAAEMEFRFTEEEAADDFTVRVASEGTPPGPLEGMPPVSARIRDVTPPVVRSFPGRQHEGVPCGAHPLRGVRSDALGSRGGELGRWFPGHVNAAF